MNNSKLLDRLVLGIVAITSVVGLYWFLFV